jgi:hypothetical protein
MMLLLCENCGAVTRVRVKEERPLLLAEDLAGLHCRACETAGGLRPAFYDQELGAWRPRRDGDVDLAELRIDGKPLSLIEHSTLDLVLTVCHARRGEWQGIDSVFPLSREIAGAVHRRTMARLIETGVLAAAGLEVQPERPGYHRLFRAAAAKASVVSGQLSVAKGHEPPTTDPAP